MYGCGDSIGCLQLSANRVGEELRVTVERIGGLESLKVSAFKIGSELSITTNLLVDKKSPLKVYAHKIGSELSVTANIVCTTGDMNIEYVPFLVKEGEFVLVDGKIFNVKSYGIY